MCNGISLRTNFLGVARGPLQERSLQFQTEMSASKVGNPCPTLGQLLARRILYVLLVGEKQHEIARARFCTQSCSKVGQLLVNSSPTPHTMRSCRGLPCNSPLATPEVLRGVYPNRNVSSTAKTVVSAPDTCTFIRFVASHCCLEVFSFRGRTFS